MVATYLSSHFRRNPKWISLCRAEPVTLTNEGKHHRKSLTPFFAVITMSLTSRQESVAVVLRTLNVTLSVTNVGDSVIGPLCQGVTRRRKRATRE